MNKFVSRRKKRLNLCFSSRLARRNDFTLALESKFAVRLRKERKYTEGSSSEVLTKKGKMRKGKIIERNIKKLSIQLCIFLRKKICFSVGHSSRVLEFCSGENISDRFGAEILFKLILIIWKFPLRGSWRAAEENKFSFVCRESEN